VDAEPIVQSPITGADGVVIDWEVTDENDELRERLAPLEDHVADIEAEGTDTVPGAQ